MGSFVIGKIAAHVLLFFAITLLVFMAFYVMPRNDPRFARRAPTEYRLHGGLMGEYGHYVWRFVRHGDLGRSYSTREKVTTRLIQATPVTLSLVAGGLVVRLLIAIPLGMLAALRPRSLLDRGSSFLVLLGLSIHPVILGLVLSYVFGHELNVLPARGYCTVDNLSTGCDGLARWADHLILPWITFGVVNAALFTMMIRALVIEELNEEYVRTAVAKGAGQGRVLRAHLLRNVTLPLVTMIGVQAATSLGGVVFIESVFDLPGLGGMLRRGAQQRDLPLTAGSVLFLALAIMTLNLLVDLFYGILDPRTRTAARTAVG